MRIAVAHEDYLERGGAEHVAESIATTFDAPIYSGYTSESELPPDTQVTELFGDGLSGLLASHSRLFRDAYNQIAWQRVDEFTEYDVIIQSGNNPGWWVPQDDQVVIKYVHSTPRTAYDLFWKRGNDPMTFIYSYFTRLLYAPYVHFPDVYVANSDIVARRIHRYWGVPKDDIEVVYPPTDVDNFSPRPTADYFLTFSRLTSNKRVDQIVKAFNGTEERLVVGGTGEQEEYLKSIAEDNIEFVGYMDEIEKKRRLGEAKALVVNFENEDFGMTPIESFASGTPVIGPEEGFTQHQVLDGENGLLHDATPESIENAVSQFEQNGVEWSRDEIENFTEKFSTQTFRTRIHSIVEEAVSEAEVTPRWSD